MRHYKMFKRIGIETNKSLYLSPLHIIKESNTRLNIKIKAKLKLYFEVNSKHCFIKEKQRISEGEINGRVRREN